MWNRIKIVVVSLKLCIKVCCVFQKQTQQVSSQTMLLTYVRELHDSSLFQDTENAHRYFVVFLSCSGQMSEAHNMPSNRSRIIANSREALSHLTLNYPCNSYSAIHCKFTIPPSSSNILQPAHYLQLSKISLKIISVPIKQQNCNLTQYL
jgi:hypothetical protein